MDMLILVAVKPSSCVNEDGRYVPLPSTETQHSIQGAVSAMCVARRHPGRCILARIAHSSRQAWVGE